MHASFEDALLSGKTPVRAPLRLFWQGAGARPLAPVLVATATPAAFMLDACMQSFEDALLSGKAPVRGRALPPFAAPTRPSRQHLKDLGRGHDAPSVKFQPHPDEG
jgi:hypothetical protein